MLKLDHATRTKLTGPALRTFFRIAAAWQLSAKDQVAILGLQSTATLRRWQSGEIRTLRKDTIERISYVLGIFAALEQRSHDRAYVDGWVHRANASPPFNGSSPLDRMTAGNVGDLFVVRQFADAQLR